MTPRWHQDDLKEIGFDQTPYLFYPQHLKVKLCSSMWEKQELGQSKWMGATPREVGAAMAGRPIHIDSPPKHDNEELFQLIPLLQETTQTRYLTIPCKLEWSHRRGPDLPWEARGPLMKGPLMGRGSNFGSFFDTKMSKKFPALRALENLKNIKHEKHKKKHIILVLKDYDN